MSRAISAHWVADEAPKDTLILAADSFLTLRECAVQGVGIAVLPYFVGNMDNSLIWFENTLPNLSVSIWVGRLAVGAVSAQVRHIQTQLQDYLSQLASLSIP